MRRLQNCTKLLAAATSGFVVFGAVAVAAPPQVNTSRAPSTAATTGSPGQFSNPTYITPFQQNIYINIADGASGGGDNGNVSPGTQTLGAPTNHKLLIQTVCMYRTGAITTSTTQIFINVSVQGTFSGFSLPPAGPSSAFYAGTCFTGNFYADAGTRILANAFRNSSSGAETDTVVVSGYMID